MRAFAFALDALLVFVGTSMVASLPRFHSDQTVWSIGLLLAFLYEGFFLQERGQTLGKAAFNIEVTRTDGEPIEPYRAWIRAFVKVGQLTCCGLPFLLALVIQERRSLHDLIAVTRVVAKHDRRSA